MLLQAAPLRSRGDTTTACTTDAQERNCALPTAECDLHRKRTLGEEKEVGEEETARHRTGTTLFTSSTAAAAAAAAVAAQLSGAAAADFAQQLDPWYEQLEPHMAQSVEHLCKRMQIDCRLIADGSQIEGRSCDTKAHWSHMIRELQIRSKLIAD